MSNIVVRSRLSITDLNDQISGATAPSNPDENSLWLDTSTSPPVLKHWNGDDWIPQRLDISELDPDLSVTIETIESTMGNMANDNMLDINERGIVVDNLYEIIGYVISNETNAPATLPTVATLEASKKGNLYQTRATAKSAGISTSASSYVAVETTYNALSTYLMNMKPIKPWDVTTANKDKFVTVVKETYRQVWLNYYLAIQKLVEDTALQVKQQIDDHDDRIVTVSAGIETLKDSLKFYASKKEVEDTLTSYPTKTEMDAAIEVKAEEINLGVKEVKETVDNMEIGGRNYLVATKSPNLTQLVCLVGSSPSYRQVPTFSEGCTRISKINDATEEVYYRFMNTAANNIVNTPLEVGQTYTLSLDVRANLVNSGRLKFRAQYIMDGKWISVPLWDGSTFIAGLDNSIFKRVNKSFTIPEGATSFYFSLQLYNSDGGIPDNGSWFEFRKAKLEKGNQPSDWSEAPEDVNKSIDNALSTSKTYTDTQIRLNTEEINLGITQKVVEEVGKVEIGGRNLLLQSSLADRTVISSNDGARYPIVKTTMNEGTRNFVRIKRSNPTLNPTVLSLFNTISLTLLSEDIRNSGKITVSFLARTQVRSSWSFMAYYFNPQTNAPNKTDLEIGTQWKRFSITFDSIPSEASALRVVPQQVIWNDSIDMKNFYIDICEYKIERGTNSSDWSLAPEDLNKSITQRNYLLETMRERVVKGTNSVNYVDDETNFMFVSKPLNTFARVGDILTFSATIKISGTNFGGTLYPQTSGGVWYKFDTVNITQAETIEYSGSITVTKELIDSSEVRMIRIRYDNVPTTVDISFTKVKLEKGSIATPWIPAYEEPSLYTAWSNKEDGSVDFTRNYPNVNLIRNYDFSKDPTKNGWAGNGATIEYSGGNMLVRFNDSSTNRRVYYADDEITRLISTGVKYSVTIDAYSNNGGLIRVGNFDALSAWQVIAPSTTKTYKFENLTGGTTNAFSIQGSSNDLVIHIFKIKIEFGSISTIYTSHPKDDPVKAEMAYIGYSSKDSDDPKDYSWNINPKARGTFKRWANDPTGETDFTSVEPYENLIIHSKSLEDTVFSTGGWQINDSSYYSGFKQLEITTTESGWKETVIDLNLPYGEIKDRVRVSLEYMNEVEGALQVTLGAYKGKNGRIKETSNIPVDTNFTLKKLPNGLTFGYYVFDTTPLQNVEGADRYVIEFKRINGKLGKAVVVKPKIINSNDLDLLYTPSPTEDPVNSKMRYIGIGSKDSDNPKDYIWQPNTEATMVRAWANDPSGQTDFTLIYPNENIASMGTLMVHSVDSANVVTITPTEIDMVSTGKVYVGFRTFGEGAYQPSTYYTMSFKLLLNSGTINHIGGHSTYIDILHGIKIDGKDVVTNGDGNTWSNGIPYNFVVGKEYDIEVRFTTKETGMHGTTTDGLFIQPNRGMPSTGWAAYTATISKFKVEEGQIRTPFITSANDDPANSIMLYEGTSLKGGNNPADYTWSPMRASATEVKEVQLQLTPDSIYAKVSQAPDYIVWKDLVDSKPSIDDLNNVYDQLDGLSSADETILASMAELEIANNGVLTSITQAVEGMDGTLSTITDYMFFGTNGLTIGKSDSPMKVNISNTELAFYDNSTKVAWVDSQRLNIGEAVVEKKIKVGNHIIEKFNDKEEITIFKYDGV